MVSVAESIVTATADLGIERHLCLLPLALLLENITGVYAPLLAGADAPPSLLKVNLFELSQVDGLHAEQLTEQVHDLPLAETANQSGEAAD